MKILKVHDPENGFVKMDCEFEQEEMEMLISHAVTDILTDQLKKADAELKGKRKCFDCEEVIDDETVRLFPDTEVCLDCMNNE